MAVHNARVPQPQASLLVGPQLIKSPPITSVQTITTATSEHRVACQTSSSGRIEATVPPATHRGTITPMKARPLTRSTPSSPWLHPRIRARAGLLIEVRIARQVIAVSPHLVRTTLQGLGLRAPLLATTPQNTHRPITLLVDLEGPVRPPRAATPLDGLDTGPFGVLAQPGAVPVRPLVPCE